VSDRRTWYGVYKYKKRKLKILTDKEKESVP